jgi:hypothetical protein
VRAAQVLAGCHPRRPLRVFRDLSDEVRRELLCIVDVEDVAVAIRRLIDEGKGEVFVGR